MLSDASVCIRLSWKLLVTYAAIEWLLACVQQHVYLQRVINSEGFIAERALERTVIGMRSQMIFEQNCGSKHFGAVRYRTFERRIFDVAPHVSLQMGLSQELLAARHAQLWTFTRIVQFVKQLMLIEMAPPVETFPTNGALEFSVASVNERSSPLRFSNQFGWFLLLLRVDRHMPRDLYLSVESLVAN